MKFEFILREPFDFPSGFDEFPRGSKDRIGSLSLPEQHVEPLVVAIDVADLNPGVAAPFDHDPSVFSMSTG